MDPLTRRLINDHRNPLVKIDIPASKLFLKPTQEEADFIIKHQNNLRNILSHERAERRYARAQATWLAESKLAKVTKIVKTINQYGYQDKTGSYLYPEETLLLMETNRLEVTFNGIPMSIQEGYHLLLSEECDIVKYKVYRKLTLLGYKLLRYSELCRRLLKTAQKHDRSPIPSSKKDNEFQRKRMLVDEIGEFKFKKFKLGQATERGDCEKHLENKIDLSANHRNSSHQIQHIESIFQSLRETAPTAYSANVMENEVPSYCVFLPNNKDRCNYDFNLYICKDPFLKKQYHNYSNPAIFAVCSEGNIAFYKFYNVTLPFL